MISLICNIEGRYIDPTTREMIEASTSISFSLFKSTYGTRILTCTYLLYLMTSYMLCVIGVAYSQNYLSVPTKYIKAWSSLVEGDEQPYQPRQ